MTLSEFQTKLATLSGVNSYHHFSPQGAGIPRIVWAEYYRNDLVSDNQHTETAWEISVNFYTKTEYDTLLSSIETLFNSLSCTWKLDNVQYESDTGLLHYEYVVKLYG